MAAPYDESDFVDRDYHPTKSPFPTTAPQPVSTAPSHHRPPTREELESKVSEAHHKLADLKRAQEELERERGALEEARRRRIEFQNGREEMLQSLTRGVGLLEEAEFAARRDAEQMAKALNELREALDKVQAIREESWKPENWQIELTRALTTIENARLEWNGARLKWPLLNSEAAESLKASDISKVPESFLSERGFADLCKVGLALTWPLAVIGLLGLGLSFFLLLSK